MHKVGRKSVMCCRNVETLQSLMRQRFTQLFNGHSEDRMVSANKIGQMQTFYDSVNVFVIDEINALSVEYLAMMHDTMSLVFNPENR